MVRNCAPENLEIPGSILSDRPGMTVAQMDSRGMTAEIASTMVPAP
jgi:hypothetical protein